MVKSEYGGASYPAIVLRSTFFSAGQQMAAISPDNLPITARCELQCTDHTQPTNATLANSPVSSPNLLLELGEPVENFVQYTNCTQIRRYCLFVTLTTRQQIGQDLDTRMAS